MYAKISLILFLGILPAIFARAGVPRLYYQTETNGGEQTVCVVPNGCRLGITSMCPPCYYGTAPAPAPAPVPVAAPSDDSGSEPAPETVQNNSGILCDFKTGGNCGLPATCPTPCLEKCNIRCLIANQEGSCLPECSHPECECC